MEAVHELIDNMDYAYGSPKTERFIYHHHAVCTADHVPHMLKDCSQPHRNGSAGRNGDSGVVNNTLASNVVDKQTYNKLKESVERAVGSDCQESSDLDLELSFRTQEKRSEY